VHLDVAANVQEHLALAQAAAEHGVPLWQAYAREQGIVVLIANHGEPSSGYVSTGRNGIWDSSGKLVAEASGLGMYLVVASMDVDDQNRSGGLALPV
jgi:predicted amidohydrolase